MKKSTFILAILMATFWANAQTVDSIPHYNLGPHRGQSETLMQMSKEGSPDCFLGGILLADEVPFNPVGYVLHKVFRLGSQMEVSDTLFLPETQMPWHFTGKNPDGTGYVLTEFYNDDGNGSCWLKIRRFNDDLYMDTTEIVLLMGDFIASSSDEGPFLDGNGDIILCYYPFMPSPSVNFVRIGLDGTVKFQKTVDNMGFVYNLVSHLKVFRESPLEYCFWGTLNDHDHVNCYFLDSLFNVTRQFILPKMSESPYYVNFDNEAYTTKLLSLNEGCFLASRTYSRPYNLVPHIEDDGVAVIKYDTMLNMLAQRKFLSEPYIQYDSYGAQSIGLERSKDGYIYFSYFTHQYYNQNQISVVKMDEDLNIIWQRHCLDREKGRMYGKMIVLDDNSVAVMGMTRRANKNEAFYIVIHDDYDDLEEQGVVVRPYAYYPNPTRDELRLHYSPDVKPTQIELYDLQSRLVKTQRTSLESLNLQGLSAGTYTMRVILEGGKVFSDKVVKE